MVLSIVPFFVLGFIGLLLAGAGCYITFKFYKKL